VITWAFACVREMREEEGLDMATQTSHPFHTTHPGQGGGQAHHLPVPGRRAGGAAGAHHAGGLREVCERRAEQGVEGECGGRVWRGVEGMLEGEAQPGRTHLSPIHWLFFPCSHLDDSLFLLNPPSFLTLKPLPSTLHPDRRETMPGARQSTRSRCTTTHSSSQYLHPQFLFSLPSPR
jgi:hypothetical protein